MKKTFILIAALAMFAGVAVADNAMFQLKAFDANTLLKENVINGKAMSEGALNDNATVDFKASGVQAQYVDTVISGETLRGYYMLITSIDGKYAFYFFINNIQDMVDGTTYTLNDMNGDYAYGVDYNLNDYMFYDAVSLTRTAGVYSGTISATGYYDNTKKRTYTLNQLQPITHPKDTVIINTTDRVEGRFHDLTNSYELIQMIGADSKYKMYLAFATTQSTGTFSESDIIDTYTGLYSIADDALIPLNNLLNDVTVYTIVGAYTATIEWVGTDSVLYNINYNYSDPEAITQTTFVADTFMITKNAEYDTYAQFNFYMYDVKAISTTGDTLSATITNQTADNAYGTWIIGDGDIVLTITDKSQIEYDAFSGSLTISADSITGSSLCYGDITYTFDIAISGPTSVDQLEAKAYTVYSEDRTIVLKGAEGQSVKLYDMAGRLVSSAKVASDNVRFPVDIAGVYMLRIGNESRRVVVE